MTLTYFEERIVEIERDRRRYGVEDLEADAQALAEFRQLAQELLRRKAGA